VWFPLYLLIIFLLLKKYGVSGIWIIIFFILAVTISDQSSGLIKDIVQRLRPSQEPLLQGKVHTPIGIGGLYGFVSGHATNVFSITVLISLIARNKWVTIMFLLWALVVSYSRIYVGVHYPGDIICGAVLGGLIGWGIYSLLRLFDSRFQRNGIYKKGAWKKEEVLPLCIALIFIFFTILLSSKVVIRYYS
jgi:undecaprenyl-diphosphatase